MRDQKATDNNGYKKPTWDEFLGEIRQKIVCYLGMKEGYRDIYACLDSGPDQIILITGERGVGKELIAKAIYSHGDRKGEPFVEANCAAIPSELIESELFGHVKGAFSGAAKNRIGKFEEADGGVLFLDEIGDLPLVTQPKLLKVMEDKRIVRVGDVDKNAKVVDVKIMVATNKNLRSEIEKGKFRGDLYDRLKGYIIDVEPLREREPDIPVLMRFFVEEENKRTGKRISAIEFELFYFCICYDWPGNVRELQSFIRVCHMNCCDGQALSLSNGHQHFKDERWKHTRTDPMDRIYEILSGPPTIAYFRAVFMNLGEDGRKELKGIFPFNVEIYPTKKKELIENVYPEGKLTDIPQEKMKRALEMPEWENQPKPPPSYYHKDFFLQKVREGNLTEAERSYVDYTTSPQFVKCSERMKEDMKYEKLVTALKRLYNKYEKLFRNRMALQSLSVKENLYELPYDQAKDKFDKEFITRALERNNGNKRKTAEQMGMTDEGLRIKMKKLNL